MLLIRLEAFCSQVQFQTRVEHDARTYKVRPARTRGRPVVASAEVPEQQSPSGEIRGPRVSESRRDATTIVFTGADSLALVRSLVAN
jgi:hypothetical protein